MKRLAVLLIAGLLAAYLAPVLWTQYADVPHHHIIVGSATAADLTVHLALERGDLPVEAGTTTIGSGIILSVPFGDWTSFFSFLTVCLFGTLVLIYRACFLARFRLELPRVVSAFPRPAIPPPRSS